MVTRQLPPGVARPPGSTAAGGAPGTGPRACARGLADDFPLLQSLVDRRAGGQTAADAGRAPTGGGAVVRGLPGRGHCLAGPRIAPGGSRCLRLIRSRSPLLSRFSKAGCGRGGGPVHRRRRSTWWSAHPIARRQPYDRAYRRAARRGAVRPARPIRIAPKRPGAARLVDSTVSNHRRASRIHSRTRFTSVGYHTALAVALGAGVAGGRPAESTRHHAVWRTGGHKHGRRRQTSEAEGAGRDLL